MPAVDQPVSEVDKREVKQDGLFPLYHYTSVHSYHASSFINPSKQQKDLQQKRNYNGWNTVIYNEWRELSSQWTNISPMKQIYNKYIAWQPSLVLGGLGRALKVPIAH